MTKENPRHEYEKNKKNLYAYIRRWNKIPMNHPMFYWYRNWKGIDASGMDTHIKTRSVREYQKTHGINLSPKKFQLRLPGTAVFNDFSVKLRKLFGF